MLVERDTHQNRGPPKFLHDSSIFFKLCANNRLSTEILCMKRTTTIRTNECVGINTRVVGGENTWALQMGFQLLDCRSSDHVTLPPLEKQIQSKWAFICCLTEANYSKVEVKQNLKSTWSNSISDNPSVHYTSQINLKWNGKLGWFDKCALEIWELFLNMTLGRTTFDFPIIDYLCI